MQIRRVLLLFALVLGLSALVASLAPPPETGKEGPSDEPTVARARPSGDQIAEVRFSAERQRAVPPRRSMPVGASATVEVTVQTAGDVELTGVGLRASADPLTPARFAVFADRAARHDVVFHPPDGRDIAIGRLVFSPLRRQPRRP